MTFDAFDERLYTEPIKKNSNVLKEGFWDSEPMYDSGAAYWRSDMLGSGTDGSEALVAGCILSLIVLGMYGWEKWHSSKYFKIIKKGLLDNPSNLEVMKQLLAAMESGGIAMTPENEELLMTMHKAQLAWPHGDLYTLSPKGKKFVDSLDQKVEEIKSSI